MPKPKPFGHFFSFINKQLLEKVRTNKLVLCTFLLLVQCSAMAQSFYRFKGEVSIKDKMADGTYRLTMGKVYYDKVYKKIVYRLQFPKKETIVVQDTTMYQINSENNVIAATKTALIPEFTVFHLALTGKLSNYGLEPKEEERPIYKIGKVEKTAKGILTTWVPADEKLKKVFGNIQMLKVDKRLDAMLFYDAKGKLISRQFFKDYENIKGIEFPKQVTMIAYSPDGKQNIQLTTYKNIQIDQSNEDEIYRYRIPVRKPAVPKK